MPKNKSHSGAAKRFSLSKRGKVKAKHANLRHNLEKQPKSAKNKNQKGAYLSGGEERRVKRLLAGQ